MGTVTVQRRRSRQVYDANRLKAEPWRAWYKLARWYKLRAQVLRDEPLCRFCLGATPQRTTASVIVDHIIAHKGDARLFWSRENTQGLCKACHDRVKQRMEARGYADTLDGDGWPADPSHPANAHHGARDEPHAPFARHGGEVKSLGPSDAGPAAPHNAKSREIGAGGRK